MSLALSLCLLSLTAQRSWAAFATEGTQVLNNVQLLLIQIREVQQLSQLTQQVANQLRMLQDMATQGRSLSQHQWGSAYQDLQRLGHVLRRGQALSYSHGTLDRDFAERFKGYDHYRQSQGTRETYQTQFKTWNQTSLDTTSATLSSLELQSDMFDTEEQTLSALQQQSQTAAGRMQAIQAGNLIAAQQVRQLQKLRQLQMSQMQMQATYMARELDQNAAQQAARDRFLQSG
ncbi:MAG: P-type conjugative transfer protein TrbJ, partial [Candidatus Tectomicrobia bacterium]|nr:P-type conjugative transfer protein TrbJ [Candidatus Tectomicrobia bacterium]